MSEREGEREGEAKIGKEGGNQTNIRNKICTE